MIPPRCLVLAVVLCAAAAGAAQEPPSPAAPAGVASPFAGDERTAKLAERYKAMLAANPAEGIALDRLWKAYEDRGATAALIEEYRDRATGNGRAPDWLVYGHLLKKTGRFDDAASAYDAASKADMAGVLPLLARGDLALVRHHPEEAARLFSDALAKLPPDDRSRADLLLKTGNTWLAAGQPAKAAEAWEQLAAANPANLALHKQLAETYARNGLADKALAHWEYIDGHADPAARAAAVREAGRRHESRGEFDAARDAYERGLALTSRDNWLHGELLTAIIRLYERAGRAAELETQWRRAVEQTPRDLGGYLRLETLAETQGDTKGEEEWLIRLTTLAPRDRDSRLKLARLLAAGGERERAAAVYDGLLKEQPDQLDLLFARADLDLQAGASADAVSRIESRLAKNPADEATSLLLWGDEDRFLGRHLDDAAEKCLRAALGPQPAALEPSVALAKFLFARRRTDEGRQVLDHAANEPGAATAERWGRVARVYKDENLPADALRCWREAAKLTPRDPAPAEAIGELLLARGDTPAAVEALQAAVANSPAGAAREEAEHRLFQVLSASSGNGGSASGRTGRRPGYFESLGPSGMTPAAPDADVAAKDSPLDRYLAGLERAAGTQPTAGSFLRLARWQLWASRFNQAMASAERAVACDPADLTARQLYVRVATDAHRHDLAERALLELEARDPARKMTYARQLAGLEMDDGDFDAAILGYHCVQVEQPGAVEPLTDLALAQQRAERWFDALATWKTAYGLPSLTPARRAEVRRPLIAAYEHVGEFQPAAELLAQAVDGETELSRRQELFQELSEFCSKHALGAWLDAQYEARLQARPDDYFTMVAVAARWKDQGRDEEAYRLLRRAYYSAPDPIAALKSLADEAETLGEDDQAVADRRRLVNMPGQDTAENLSKLAALQEDNLDEDAAARTWEQIAARFPRDTNSLASAADFFERINQPERARALLVRVDSIEPGDLPHLFHLAELARDAGDLEAARETFEKVLARSEGEKPGDPLRLPAELEGAAESPFSRHGSTFFLTSPPAAAPDPAGPGSDDHILRLAAIRELARLLTAADAPPGHETRNRWLERWKAAASAGGRSEPLQAFFYSGDATGAMDLLAGWMSEQPADRSLRQAFLRAGMQLGDYGRLARWAWLGEADERGVRGSQLVEALQRFLAEGGKPGANIVGELFPPSVRARDLLWKAAKEGFAERRWYAPAAELGERVVTLAAIDRSASALEVAQWELFLDHPERARAVLRQTLNDPGGIALDGSGGSAVYEALRAYYLLLTPGERAPFVDAYLRECEARGEPVRRVLPAVLLHALQGEETRARQDLDALLALRPAVPASDERSPEARHWSYLLDAGAQLENWNFASLAAYLWREALRGATAFDRADASASALLAEIRGRLAVLQVTTAPDPESGRECLAAYLRENPRTELLRSAAAQLLAASQWPAARQLYEFLTRQEPANAENWRNLLGACEASGDLDATEQVLVALLGTPRAAPFSINPAELVRELAAVHQSEGDTAGAVRLLEREFHDGTRSLPVVSSLASAYEGMGKLDEAARVWQEGITADLGNAKSCYLEQARLEERRGNLRGAISLLKGQMTGRVSPGAAGAATELVSLYLRTGQIDQAKDLASAGLSTNAFDDPGGVAEAFVRANQSALIRELLRSAILRSHDPQRRFQLQQSWLQHAPPAEFPREMRRLEHFAQGVPALKSAYVAVRCALARQHGADAWLEGELQREWRDGRGDFAAGEQLVGFYLDTRQTVPLERVVRAIDARPNLPETPLANLEKRLTDAGLAALALPVSERLLRRFPQNEQYAFARARVLWKSGRLDEARALLEALDRSSVFREDLAARIAALYEELGDLEQARAYDERAVQRDPAGGRSAAACLRLAQMEVQRKDWAAAAPLLRKAYRQPVIAGDLTPLVDFLQASGQLDGSHARILPGNGFPLTFPVRAQLLSLAYARLKSVGKLPEARAMVAAHPGFLAASPPLAAAWRQDAAPGEIPAAIGALEDAAQSAAGPTPRLNRDLAALYLRWADDAVNAEGRDPASRLERLVRARQLAPDDFDVARRLAALCWEQSQPEQAAAALQPFLADDAVPEERRQAQELLAEH